MSTTPDGVAFSLLDDLTSFGVAASLRFDHPSAERRVALATRWRGAAAGMWTDSSPTCGWLRKSRWKGESALTAARAGAGVATAAFLGLMLSEGGEAIFTESSWRMLVFVVLAG